ncbi:YxeA family protein [Lactococcus lactis subsp. lactis]|jgi:uncharacterized protein (TIGR01655 family)|uniref:YxeA family protein n=1 Tax=Lactococcus lactis TaxID=1358 RepID=UPI00071D7BB9|nr:YxeA family protein [Lactococcus lactis]MDT3326218.1 YxeA family protein [Bacillota bacterium]KST80730.1 hypothetical protein LK231_0401 [Lactococcus lactis subsp. lactis]MBR8678539.1 YxeA family protein [Lactococcus lactis subsp. lactis]MBR8681034.1 YxeA family protein [Lactococcus lactis subsp. lactis]MBR8686158.1 YxeA family protein [Lactococcus lactis subsp. lactis]
MKKIFFGLATVLLVILIGSGYTWYKVNYGGTAYYVQINKNGKEEEKITSDSSAKYKQYAYDIDFYQKDGKVKRVDFNTDHNLRKEAYLKLKVNSTKEVKKSEVPKAALEKLKE